MEYFIHANIIKIE